MMLVKKLWAKRQTVYYRDIDNLIIDSAVVDAYQIAKLSLRGKQRRFEKYRILDIRIVAKEQKIHFRTKWFDTFQQENQALSLLLEHVDNSVVKKGEYSPITLLNEVVFVAKWILVFFLLTLIGNWLLSCLSVYTS